MGDHGGQSINQTEAIQYPLYANVYMYIKTEGTSKNVTLTLIKIGKRGTNFTKFDIVIADQSQCCLLFNSVIGSKLQCDLKKNTVLFFLSRICIWTYCSQYHSHWRSNTRATLLNLESKFCLWNKRLCNIKDLTVRWMHPNFNSNFSVSAHNEVSYYAHVATEHHFSYVKCHRIIKC